MYLNFQLLAQKNIRIETITTLIAIKQNKIEPLSSYLEENVSIGELKALEELGYVYYIKGSKKQIIWELVRITDKAKKLIDDLSIADVDEDSLKIFEWVKSIYLRENKEIGNAKKCKQFIAQFSKESGIVRNELAFLIQSFLSDEKEFEYSQRMEYLFYKGASVFSVRFDLSQSRLYQYYQKREIYFLEQFKKL